jgi:diguanylate cyclase (GGDEF)-like protein
MAELSRFNSIVQAQKAAARGDRATGYVLVATPNVSRADLYRTVISDLGHEVVVVRDGQEAQACLSSPRGAPALLVADLSLPKLDTFTLLKYLRRDATLERTSIIVVSAYEQLRASARSMADSLGISKILAADTERSAFVEAVKQSLRPTPVPEPPAAVPAPGRSAGRGAPQLHEALGAVVLEVARRFGASACFAYLKLRDQEKYAVYVTASDHAPTIAPHAQEWLLVKQVATAGEPLVLPDLQANPGFSESLGMHAPVFRGFAGVPLFAEHVGASGALCIVDNDPTTLGATDIDSLVTLAAELERQIETSVGTGKQAAAPIAATIDVETLERLAVTDPLTGLANRRGGERSVASEISRARRQRTALSCIFIDIDNFKRINDTFGHQAGDRLLRDMSDLLRHTLRAYDILVRWGGEEFLLILPGVTLDQARRLAERIRAAVERLDTQGLGPVTISAGTAALDASYDFETMLMAADRRLYEAKSSGRNTVV